MSIADRPVQWVQKLLRKRIADEHFDAANYWETRYSSGGDSGDGSYGALAQFKAEVMNDLVQEMSIGSAIEFGCGDGNQLSLIDYPGYVGLDVSRSILSRCIRRFSGDESKSFFLYDSSAFHDATGILKAELAVSLDVIYHIVADDVFNLYMTHLCGAASRYLVVYSTNVDAVESVHIHHRAFGEWIAMHRPEFQLYRVIDNPNPGLGVQQSNASFFIYSRRPGETTGA